MFIFTRKKLYDTARRSSFFSIGAIMALFMLIALPADAQKRKKKKKKGTPPGMEQKMPGGFMGGMNPFGKKGMKPYKKVITKEAVSDEGLFLVHKVKEKYFFEIPDSLLGRDMLMVSRISGYVEGLSFGGAGMKAKPQHMIRWERQEDRILLRYISSSNIASKDLPVYKSVVNNNFSPVVAAFDIAAINRDSTATVIEVNSLFNRETNMISALSDMQKRIFQARMMDPSRSYVEEMKSFPENIVIKHVQTYNAARPPANSSTNTLSVGMTQSIVLLPEKPMMPRLFDRRVGFFTIDKTDYGSEEHQAKGISYLTRWRLEPKDPEAYARGELTEPVKPIVYYVDNATPEPYREFMKKGIEDWQKAFEAAGFKNAIIAKDMPTKEEDPEFDPEDIRYSVIRYITTKIQNAQGPHVHDPRSGEIIESDILWYHNVMTTLRNWMFTQVGMIRPEVRKPHFDTETIGLGIRFVAAHEVGHTLGLPHNMGASFAYPTDSLRSKSFTDKFGICPTIMDYARFNYVAQEGDNITKWYNDIGPYDLYSINWAYRYYPDVKSPQEEKEKYLDKIILEKAGDPVYWFGRQAINEMDPRSLTEAIGNDAVKASEYGMINLKKIMTKIPEWGITDGEDYTETQELYNSVIQQWNRYNGHVVKNIGGVYETFKTSGQEGAVYEPVPAEVQKSAMEYLRKHAFETPDWMLDEKTLRLFEHAGAVDRVRAYQASALGQLLDFSRLSRMIESEAFDPEKSYRLTDMMNDLRNGIWAELKNGKKTDTYRRNLQRVYLSGMEDLMNEDQAFVPPAFRSFFDFTPVNVEQSDIRPIVRGELRALKRDIQRRLGSERDSMTRYHLEDAVVRINEILDPNKD